MQLAQMEEVFEIPPHFRKPQLLPNFTHTLPLSLFLFYSSPLINNQQSNQQPTHKTTQCCFKCTHLYSSIIIHSIHLQPNQLFENQNEHGLHKHGHRHECSDSVLSKSG